MSSSECPAHKLLANACYFYFAMVKQTTVCVWSLLRKLNGEGIVTEAPPDVILNDHPVSAISSDCVMCVSIDAASSTIGNPGCIESALKQLFPHGTTPNGAYGDADCDPNVPGAYMWDATFTNAKNQGAVTFDTHGDGVPRWQEQLFSRLPEEHTLGDPLSEDLYQAITSHDTAAKGLGSQCESNFRGDRETTVDESTSTSGIGGLKCSHLLFEHFVRIPGAESTKHIVSSFHKLAKMHAYGIHRLAGWT